MTEDLQRNMLRDRNIEMKNALKEKDEERAAIAYDSQDLQKIEARASLLDPSEHREAISELSALISNPQAPKSLSSSLMLNKTQQVINASVRDLKTEKMAWNDEDGNIVIASALSVANDADTYHAFLKGNGHAATLDDLARGTKQAEIAADDYERIKRNEELK